MMAVGGSRQGVTALPQCRPDPEGRRAEMASAREKLVADVARCRRQADAARLAPGGSVDLFLVADLQAAGNLLGHEDRIAHLTAGHAVLGLHFLPELDRTELELG